MSVQSVFRSSHNYAAPVAAEATDEAEESTAEFALRLVRSIAEAPLVPGRYRIAARRHLARLAPREAVGPVEDE